MPGFEIIGKEEKLELNSIFKKAQFYLDTDLMQKEKGLTKLENLKITLKINSNQNTLSSCYIRNLSFESCF